MPGFASYGAGAGNYGVNYFQTPDTTQREVLGTIVTAVDPVWGGVEVIYARAANTIRQFGVCILRSVWDATAGGWRVDASEVANTANQGCNLAIAMASMTVGQYGWFVITGTVPINCTASVAANAALGIAAAGQGGANSAGKQILNAVCSAPASTAIAKTNCTAASGSRALQVPNSDGWFPGLYLSGTGIAAGTTVVAIDPSGRFVTLSADTTAVVNGTVTGTYNNGTVYYNVAQVSRPFAQGAIT